MKCTLRLIWQQLAMLFGNISTSYPITVNYDTHCVIDSSITVRNSAVIPAACSQGDILIGLNDEENQNMHDDGQEQVTMNSCTLTLQLSDNKKKKVKMDRYLNEATLIS